MNTTAKRLDPGLRRNLLIIGGVLAASMLGLFAVVVMRVQSPSTGPAAAVVVPPGAATAGGQKKEGPPSAVMQQLVREQQTLESENARLAGRPYIPPDASGTEPVLVATPTQVTQLTMPPTAPMTAGQILSVESSQEAQTHRERLRRGIDAQLRELMLTAAPPGAAVRIQGVVRQATQPSAMAASSAAPESRVNTASQMGSPHLVDALEIFVATTLTAVDTYRSGFISVRIIGGRLDGAFLTGRAQLVNEGLQSRFSQMRLNGRTYAIDAVGLDEQTGTDAIRADLDHRYLQRYVMPVMVAMLGGYTSAMSQTGSTTVNLAGQGEGVGVTQPAPTHQQAVNAGVASAMSIAQRAVDRDAALPSRASLPAGSAIGILFTAPVAEVDAIGAQPASRVPRGSTDRSITRAVEEGAQR